MPERLFLVDMNKRKEYQKQKNAERKLTHKRVELYLPIAEYKTFQKLANKEQTSANTLIKNMAIAYRDTRYFMPAELKQELTELSLLIRNIANNLNQLSHSANIFQEVDKNLVFSHLQTLDSTIKNFVDKKIK